MQQKVAYSIIVRMVKLVEHEPKPGTIRHTVWKGISEGKSLREIRRENNYRPKQAYAAAIRVIDELDRGRIKEEWSQYRSEATLNATYSIIPDIAPFVGMDMVTLEAQSAMINTYGITYGYVPVQTASLHARRIGYKGLRRFSDGEVQNLRKEAIHQYKDQIPTRVAQWLDAAAVLLTHPSHPVPGSREEWKSAIERYKKQKLINAENSGEKWRSVFRHYYNNNRPLPVDWSVEGLVEERVFVRREVQKEANERLWNSEEFRKLQRQGSREHGVLRPKAEPFVLRRILSRDIQNILQLTKEQTQGAVKALRKQHSIKLSDEEIEKTHKRARLGRESHELTVPSAMQEKSFAVVRRFFAEGYITNDLSNWEQLSAIFERGGRDLPYEPGHKLILEIYLKVLQAVGQGDLEPLAKYESIKKEAGLEDDPNNLKLHERFLEIKFFSPWADGEDKNGLYVLRGGKRVHRIVDEKGTPEPDTTLRAVKRMQEAGKRPTLSPNGTIFEQEKGGKNSTSQRQNSSRSNPVFKIVKQSNNGFFRLDEG